MVVVVGKSVVDVVVVGCGVAVVVVVEVVVVLRPKSALPMNVTAITEGFRYPRTGSPGMIFHELLVLLRLIYHFKIAVVYHVELSPSVEEEPLYCPRAFNFTEVLRSCTLGSSPALSWGLIGSTFAPWVRGCDCCHGTTTQ